MTPDDTEALIAERAREIEATVREIECAMLGAACEPSQIERHLIARIARLELAVEALRDVGEPRW